MNANRFSVWFILTSHLDCSQLLGEKIEARKYGEHSHHGRERERRRKITNISVNSFVDFILCGVGNIVERTNIFRIRVESTELFVELFRVVL
jgi:hypothetical protein